jgi:hypothetical protein
VRPLEEADADPEDALPAPPLPLLREDELALARDPSPFEEALGDPRV